MRNRKSKDGLTVHAIAGTYVVLLGMSLSKAAGQGFLGFSIHRTDHTENEAGYLQAMKAYGLDHPAVSFPRTEPKSYIQHNKFMVRVRNGKALSVWTGGINFSRSGILGHSNVAHVVEHPDIVDAFMQYWHVLSQNRESSWTEIKREALAPARPAGMASTCKARARKAERQAGYSRTELGTFAFGMGDVFKDVYETGKSPLRWALMDKLIPGMKPGPKKEAEIARMVNIRKMQENVVAVGSMITTNAIDGWVKERLTGYSNHVKYVHNKFMLVDPLTTDPIVIAGSANFSKASVMNNDENMVICRGNMRVADIYLGEFLRLYSYHAFREWLSNQTDPANLPAPKPLRTDDGWWQSNFGNTTRSRRREYFA